MILGPGQLTTILIPVCILYLLKNIYITSGKGISTPAITKFISGKFKNKGYKVALIYLPLVLPLTKIAVSLRVYLRTPKPQHL